MKLVNKTAVITGASHGLGFAIANQFARERSDVCLCGRNAAELERAAAQIKQDAVEGTRVLAMPADVSSETDVARLADFVQKQFPALDTLVCNAGVYGPKGPIEEVEWSAWSEAISINLLGAVLCCRAFLPSLRKSRRAKILLISGGGATKPLPFLSAYAASKAALVRFGETLAEELRDANIDVNTIAPGALNTRLLDEILAAGPQKVGQPFYESSIRQKESGGTPLEKGADLCVYLASDAANGITGKLISAVWDPWREFDKRLDDLNRTDVYTLRRIVPRERGLSWG